jgi:hypothetical protein
MRLQHQLLLEYHCSLDVCCLRLRGCSHHIVTVPSSPVRSPHRFSTGCWVTVLLGRLFAGVPLHMTVL